MGFEPTRPRGTLRPERSASAVPPLRPKSTRVPGSPGGRCWTRTSDLLRVKQALSPTELTARPRAPRAHPWRTQMVSPPPNSVNRAHPCITIIPDPDRESIPRGWAGSSPVGAIRESSFPSASSIPLTLPNARAIVVLFEHHPTRPRRNQIPRGSPRDPTRGLNVLAHPNGPRAGPRLKRTTPSPLLWLGYPSPIPRRWKTPRSSPFPSILGLPVAERRFSRPSSELV